ncbi:MAG: leucine-rich repeat protein [Bacteroidales bacterium]|jgi:hypothetical protein|nr:leucine-rich repeat protein [Bacteroidales bacterium]
MKKIITNFILVIVFVCCSSVSQSQTIIASGTTGSLTWELTSDSILTISGSGAMVDNDRPWYAYYDKIKSVIVGNNVTTIGNASFQYCSNLTSVTIGNAVTTIGYGAFSYCSSLSSIHIPSSVTSISTPYENFYGCASLTSINVDTNSNYYSSDNGILYSKMQDTLICCPDGKTGNVMIPYSVVTIGINAFRNCANLTSINLTNTVNSIKSDAFYGCGGLTSITIPSTVNSITGNVFRNCSSLTSINVSANNYYYSSLDGILYNKTRDTLICCPGGKTGEVIVPNFVTTIGNYAFAYCHVTSVMLPPFASSIGSYAFQYCSSLTSIDIPNHITSIRNGTFYYCSNLISVTIPNFITLIETAAFSGCGALASITIPSSVTTIQSDVFGYCYGLTFIKVDAPTPPQASISFYGIPTGIPVYVPCGSLTAYQNDSYWSYFTNYHGIGTTTNYTGKVCPDETYTDDNFTTPISSAGIYYRFFPTDEGCDSLVALNFSFYVLDTTTYSVTICGGTTYSDNNFTEPISDTGVYHYLTLQGVNGCDSVVGVKVHYYPQADTPTNVFVLQVGNDGLTVFWNDQGDIYNVYRNGDLIATLDTSGYVDTDLVSGERYCYKIKAVDDCNSESEFSNEACYTYTYEAYLTDVELASIKMYPNPASDKLFVEGYNFNGIKIYSLSGMEVLNLSINDSKTMIDISHLTNGVYYLCLLSDGQVIGGKKLIKQ